MIYRPSDNLASESNSENGDLSSTIHSSSHSVDPAYE